MMLPAPPLSRLPMNLSFALLEDGDDSDARSSRSRLYTDYSRTLRCTDAAGFPDLLTRMQAALAGGEHAVALFDYELGAAQHRVAAWPEVLGLPGQEPATARPLAEILLFRQCRRPSAAELENWLVQRSQAAGRESDAAPSPVHMLNLRADIDRTAFDAALSRIHNYLAAGDCYQVNYTYRLHFDVLGSPAALYRKLRARQPTRYGALIVLPDGRAVVSCSPELFMRHSAGRLTVQPMKGTAPAAGGGSGSGGSGGGQNGNDDYADSNADAIANRLRADALAADPKNRAENLMIVDLLRNDLGRVAVPGTVRVDALFDVQRYGRVLQMTSTVEAAVHPDATLHDILAALYPCGSITGAPKLRAMQIIRELENAPRGLYTGALGWFDAPEPDTAAGAATIGDFCLSVPIRTLTLEAPQQGRRKGILGIGAGIVYDSVAAEEYDECLLKARFLTGLSPDFQLFETIHATGEESCRHLERHLQRLRCSAQACGFVFDEKAIRAVLLRTAAALAHGTPHRLRLTLAHDGAVEATSAPLSPIREPVKLFIAGQPNPVDAFFIANKTTVREVYDEAWRAAERRGGFDQLFVNRDGNLTEGGRSSVFVKLDGRWFTPPLTAGVLPGVMREVLLDDPAWDATERNLTLADVRRAEEVVVCNALRGVLRAHVDWQ